MKKWYITGSYNSRMVIPNHKVKAAIVFVLAIGMGIGIPLLSRMQGQDLEAALAPPGGGSVQPPSPPPPPSQSQQPSIPTPTLACTANPPAVYVGDPVVWQIQTTNIKYPNLLTYIWSGAVTGQGQTMTTKHSMAGTFTATVQYDSFELGKKQATCSVNVLEKPTQQSSGGSTGSGSSGSGGTGSSGSGSGSSGSGSSGSSNPTPPAESVNTTGSSSGSGQAGAASPDLSPAPDILTCKLINPTIYVSENKISMMRCTLKPPALITARIIKGDYSPPNDPDAASIIKTLVYEKSVYDQTFSFNWNGIDSYDNPVPDGSYSFVVSARQSTATKPDISMQKIQVMLNRPPQTQETSTETAPAGAGEQTTAGPAQTTETTAPPPAPEAPKPPEPSKCPGINYPNDIENHWAKDFIRLAYDNCIFRGYPDGGFHPDEQMMRGEAVKAALVTAGIPPKLGCYDADCGTPFMDLLSWQSQWLRAAWDLKIVKGITDTLFAPQRAITRGEAAVLIAKAFKIPAHKNCYTPNCGAGYPNNFFIDIEDPGMGSYLRALWDLKVIRGSAQNAFEPNRPITRAEMAALLMKIAQRLGKISVSQPTPAPTPSPSQGTPGTTSSSQQTQPTQSSSEEISR